MHNHYFTEILHILRKNRVPDSKIRFALLQKNWTKTRSLALLLQSAPLTASSKRKPQLVDISKLDLNRKIKKKKTPAESHALTAEFSFNMQPVFR